MVTSDHGQGRGIGGHGHLTEPERRVPFIAWGEGVPHGVRIEDARSLLDVAPTLAYYLGAPPPAQSVGQVLFTPEGVPARHDGPLAIVIPAYNEAEVLPEVLARIPRARLGDIAVVVVDDGSTDGTSEVAERAGDEAIWNDYTGHFGDQTWLDSFVMSAIRGTGAFAGESDLVRRQGIQNQVMVAWSLHEVIAALGKAGDGNFDPASGAPHNWDEGWAFYHGADPSCGPYATADSRGGNFGTGTAVNDALAAAFTEASRRSSPATPRQPRRPRTRSCGRSPSPTCRRRSATPSSSTATSEEAAPARPACTRPRAGRSTA